MICLDAFFPLPLYHQLSGLFSPQALLLSPFHCCAGDGAGDTDPLPAAQAGVPGEGRGPSLGGVMGPQGLANIPSSTSLLYRCPLVLPRSSWSETRSSSRRPYCSPGVDVLLGAFFDHSHSPRSISLRPPSSAIPRHPSPPPAIPRHPPPRSASAADVAVLSQSLFERLQRAGTRVTMLKEQYRMHPDISRYVFVWAGSTGLSQTFWGQCLSCILGFWRGCSE